VPPDAKKTKQEEAFVVELEVVPLRHAWVDQGKSQQGGAALVRKLHGLAYRQCWSASPIQEEPSFLAIVVFRGAMFLV